MFTFPPILYPRTIKETQPEETQREDTPPPEPVTFNTDSIDEAERDDLNDYERIQDPPSPSYSADNNNEEKDESPVIIDEIEKPARTPSPEPIRAPTPEPIRAPTPEPVQVRTACYQAVL
jgi:hypothetical protein